MPWLTINISFLKINFVIEMKCKNTLFTVTFLQSCEQLVSPMPMKEALCHKRNIRKPTIVGY